MKKIIPLLLIVLPVNLLAFQIQKTTKSGIEMILVKAGNFTIGARERDIDFYNEEQKNAGSAYGPKKMENVEIPCHRINISRDFYIGKYEVTQELWLEITGYNPSQNSYKGDRKPVEYISWYDAIEFCNTLSYMEGLTLYYNIDRTQKNPNSYDFYDDLKYIVTINPDADGYRLPTEAQWEYAARGGHKASDTLYSGSDSIRDVAWFSKAGGPSSHEVGLKEPNELGIYDMSGNVKEWCWDWMSYYTEDDKTDPLGPDSGKVRSMRGGSFVNRENGVRVAYRNWASAHAKYRDLGIRLVLPGK